MDSPPQENQPCPLQFYDFRQLDHTLHCPTYSTILDRPDDPISVDDLDRLQTDLLALQTNVQTRIQLLESELAILNDWQVKRDYNRKRRLSDVSEPTHRPVQTAKRQKTEPEPTPPPRRSKQTKTHPTEAVIEPHSSKYKSKGKGDAPDRFWGTVEPYCADITAADISLLQEDIKNQQEEGEIYTVPPLGRHYSLQWAVEELSEERREGERMMENIEPGNRGEKEGWKEESESLLKQASSLSGGQAERHYGPLTQRLMAAFLEDPLGGKFAPPSTSQRKLSVVVSPPKTTVLEERIKEELTLLGLLEPAEVKEDGEEDEILAELTRKQAELRAVSEYNSQQLKMFVSLARAEMERQEIRKLAQAADEEVTDILGRFTSAKQKKRASSRKEREAAWKALERRDSLYQKLEQL